MSMSDQCISCKHYLGLQECEAFKKIPFEIYSGEFDHRKPFKGDNGIQFEPLEEKETNEG